MECNDGRLCSAGEVFEEMQRVGMKSDQSTYMSILNACVCPTALKCSNKVHVHIIDADFNRYVSREWPILGASETK